MTIKRSGETMTIWAKGCALLAATFLAAEPCVAQQFQPSNEPARTGAFAGLDVRIALTRRPGSAEHTRAGFRLGLSQSYRTAEAGPNTQHMNAELLNFGLYRSGRPTVQLLGRQLIDSRGKLSLDDEDGEGRGVSPWLIVAGVTVLGLGAGAIILNEQLNKCHDHDDEC